MHCRSVRIWGEVQRQEYVQLLEQNFKMASCPFEAWWLFDSKPDQNYVEPKMERKFATEYSTAEKWASKSQKWW